MARGPASPGFEPLVGRYRAVPQHAARADDRRPPHEHTRLDRRARAEVDAAGAQVERAALHLCSRAHVQDRLRVGSGGGLRAANQPLRHNCSAFLNERLA